MKLFAAIFGVLLLASTYPVQAQDLPFAPRTDTEIAPVKQEQQYKYLSDIVEQFLDRRLTDVGREFLIKKLIKENAKTQFRIAAEISNASSLLDGRIMLFAEKDETDFRYDIICIFEKNAIDENLYLLKRKDSVLITGYLQRFEGGDATLNDCEIIKK